MNADKKKRELPRSALAISVWENEGGATGPDSIDCHYGRRIETDRSWTVYHVFSGAPARINGRFMTGLSRQDATDSMLAINRSNVVRRTERGKLPAPSAKEGGPS